MLVACNKIHAQGKMSSLLLTHFAAGIRSGGFQYNFFQKCCSEVNPVHNPCSKTGSFAFNKTYLAFYF